MPPSSRTRCPCMSRRAPLRSRPLSAATPSRQTSCPWPLPVPRGPATLSPWGLTGAWPGAADARGATGAEAGGGGHAAPWSAAPARDASDSGSAGRPPARDAPRRHHRAPDRWHRRLGVRQRGGNQQRRPPGRGWRRSRRRVVPARVCTARRGAGGVERPSAAPTRLYRGARDHHGCRLGRGAPRPERLPRGPPSFAVREQCGAACAEPGCGGHRSAPTEELCRDSRLCGGWRTRMTHNVIQSAGPQRACKLCRPVNACCKPAQGWIVEWTGKERKRGAVSGQGRAMQ